MKKLIILPIFLLLGISAHAQVSTLARVQAQELAKGISLALGLSANQEKQLYEVNLTLMERKLSLRRLPLHVDSLRLENQRIEDNRSLLYRDIVNNEEKYRLYLSKRLNLLTVNIEK